MIDNFIKPKNSLKKKVKFTQIVQENGSNLIKIICQWSLSSN